MKFKFWKKKRKSGLTVNVMIDGKDIERTFQRLNAGINDGHISNLAKCGRFVRVEYNPANEGSETPNRYPAWQICFNVALADRTGLYYGNKGVEIVNEIGLPGNLKNIFLVNEDNGRAVVKSADCPTPTQITRLAQEIERATTEILDEYRRFETMGRLHKGKK